MSVTVSNNLGPPRMPQEYMQVKRGTAVELVAVRDINVPAHDAVREFTAKQIAKATGLGHIIDLLA